ncbi:MAG: ECF-type sigma factor [Acidobacteriota bacterium]
MTCRTGRDSPEIETTRWLQRWSHGDLEARSELIEHLYPQLRRLVGHHLRRGSADPLLQTTELMHELYLALDEQQRCQWQDRNHFFAIAGRLLRRVIVDHERHRLRDKRGGGRVHLPLEEALGVASTAGGAGIDVLALNRALTRLETIDPQAARIVDLRYFGGLSHDETAEALGIGRATVARRWRFARAWLRRQLGAGAAAERSAGSSGDEPTGLAQH